MGSFMFVAHVFAMSALNVPSVSDVPTLVMIEAKQSSPEERHKTGFTMQDSVKTVRR